MVCRKTLERQARLPALWLREHQGWCKAQVYAFPLSQERMPETVQRENWNGDGGIQDWIPGLDTGYLLDVYQSQVNFQHEATS